MDPYRPVNPFAIRHIPTVLEQTHRGERAWDVFSLLLKDRIVFLGSEVDDFVANSIVAQFLYLEAQDPERDIYLYVNSPGGSVIAGMAIYDTIQHIRPDVSTICVGHAMSMGALLLAAGTKGKRKVLPHSRVMIHQPWSGGVGGQVTDIEIRAKQLVKTKNELNQILANHTGQTMDRIVQDTERDYYMSAEEALAYGIVDEVLSRPALSAT